MNPSTSSKAHTRRRAGSAPLWMLTAMTALALGALLPRTAQAQVDVTVSVPIKLPGVYGRVDVGNFPQPRVVVAQPVVVYPQPVQVQPVYMWVPPGHRKDWKKHCKHYGACGVPVYFVRHDWYDQQVMKGGKGRSGPPQAQHASHAQHKQGAHGSPGHSGQGGKHHSGGNNGKSGKHDGHGRH